MISLYNTLSRKNEKFKPIKKGHVGIYSCGPTVYWYQHIGNLRTYIFSDVLRRVLQFNGYHVKHVINVTDVGHLTSDADEGEDKIEKAAIKEGKTAKEISEFYFNVFKEDLHKLNILFPNNWSKATEHIEEQINLIKKLQKKGYTYETNDGIYFDTTKFKNYGKLARINTSELQHGKRISLGEKKNPTDFALWKFSTGEKRLQEWNSPWGKGFPGWHIECSAMSMKYLGDHFDIHTGGMDHIPIHHTNEIAQSEGATGKKFVNYWLHGAFLLYNGEKVSKSKGGLFTVSELEEKGFPALAFRYMALTTSYRKPMNFSMQNLEAAKNSLERLKNIISDINDDKKTNKTYLKEFEEKINDDLDMPNALQVLWNMLRDEKADGKFQTLKKMDEVLGLNLLSVKEESEIPEKVRILAEERQRARDERNFKKSDELRVKISNLGYVIEDKVGSYSLKKK